MGRCKSRPILKTILMKVQLIKDHFLEGKKGDEIEVTDARANYFIRHGVAEKVIKKEKVEKNKNGTNK